MLQLVRPLYWGLTFFEGGVLLIIEEFVMTIRTEAIHTKDTVSEVRSGCNRRKRLKIWEVPSPYHFSIISFCLSTYERKKLYEGSTRSDADECQLRVIQEILTKTQKQSLASLNMQEALDSKFRLHIDKIRDYDEAALQKIWQDSQNKSDLNGIYWALMSNGSTGHIFRNKIFQEVSIYSYQSCCKLLSIQRRHDVLKHEASSKDDKLQALQQEVKTNKCSYCNQISSLEQELCLAQYEIDRLQRHLSLYTCKINN